MCQQSLLSCVGAVVNCFKKEQEVSTGKSIGSPPTNYSKTVTAITVTCVAVHCPQMPHAVLCLLKRERLGVLS